MSSNPRTTRNSQKSGIGDALQSLVRYSTPGPEASSSSYLPYHPQPEFAFGDRITEEPEEPEEFEEPDAVNNITDDNDPSEHPEQGDDANVPANPPPPPANDPNGSLARSLELLAKKIGSISEKPSDKPSAVKPRVPDLFDGTDTGKLEVFTFQCSMYIATCAKDFPDDSSRVAFMLSYLKGTPLDWFQSELSHAINRGGRLPRWFSSYPIFLAELHRLYGPRDPVTDAMNALEALKYKDSTKANRYILDFNRHSRRSGWNEMALSRQFYKGLPDRLKDEVSRIGKPVGLRPLQDLVSTLDERHWERQKEISRDKRAASGNTASNSKASSSSPDKDSDNRADNQKASGSKSNQQQSGKNKDQKKQSNDAKKPSSSSSEKSNSIADILGPDGKLKPEERQRRMDKDLCLRCGNPGHKASDCPGNKPKPKGRAAKASPAAPDADPASSGKA